MYSFLYFNVLWDFVPQFSFFSGAARKEHGGHGLEPQGQSCPFCRRGSGKEKVWALGGGNVCYLPSRRDNSRSEDKNLDIKVACFHSRSV